MTLHNHISVVSCCLLPSYMSWRKNYVKPLHCFALSWYKPNQYQLVDSNNCSSNNFDMSLDCQTSTFIYSYSRFQKWKLTSPRLDERMEVSSPWFETTENDEMNSYLFQENTFCPTGCHKGHFSSSKPVPWIKFLFKVWWSAHPLVQNIMLHKAASCWIVVNLISDSFNPWPKFPGTIASESYLTIV